MNFQQLKIIRESARCNYNLTEVANRLYTSQSGVSRHIREFEGELGVEIFVRRGKRLLGLTEPGKQLLTIVEHILNEVQNIQRLADVFSHDETGQIVIAVEFSQAHYHLAEIIKQFRLEHPHVNVTLNQQTSQNVGELLIRGNADIGIVDDLNFINDQLVAFPYDSWNHLVLLPIGHALLAQETITLSQLSRYPLITYHHAQRSRQIIDTVFEQLGIAPTIVISTADPKIIKECVILGLGIGIISEIAFDPNLDTQLIAIPVDHLFPANPRWLLLKRYQLQRNFIWHFMQLCDPNLSLTGIKYQIFASDTRVIDFQI